MAVVWPAIGHAQFLQEKPEPKGGDAAGAWMADSTALTVWVDQKILNVISDITMDGTVSGSLTLQADSGTYVADYASSVLVKMSASLFGVDIKLDSTFVTPMKQEGDFEIKDSSLILEHTPEGTEQAVRDTFGFSVREDSLFILQDVPLGQYSIYLGLLQAETPLAVLGFAKVDEEPPPPEPPTEPEPPVTVIAADFNGNGSVDFQDFLAFAQNFGRSEGDLEYDDRFDLNGNRTVDFGDFVEFAKQFGK